MRRVQKGQSIVEFALILPLFLLLVFGICQFGFAFSDYLALSNVARNSAREASIGTDPSDIYYAVAENNPVPMNIYHWDPLDTNDFYIEIPENLEKNHDLVVHIHAEIEKESSLVYVFCKLAGVDSSLFDIDTEYHMYYEPKQKT